MHLSQPAWTFANGLDFPVLSVLARQDREWTTGEVARAAGVTIPGARAALTRMAEAGLVRVTSLGRMRGYRLNRHHVMAAAVLAICAADAELRRRIVKQVEGWSLQPVSVVWFGSWAQGQANANRDVDLLLVHPEWEGAALPTWEAQLAELERSIGEWSGNGCDLLSYSESEWRELVASGEPLTKSIRPETSMLLWGRRVDTQGRAPADGKAVG